jgi:hypothetical protein
LWFGSAGEFYRQVIPILMVVIYVADVDENQLVRQ